jgi:hypothetical protein
VLVGILRETAPNMAVIDIDVARLHSRPAKKTVAYLNEVRQTNADIAICKSLLELVEEEYASPYDFSLFLSWSKCPDTIAMCIRSSPSCFIRTQGIKQFGKALIDSERWEAAWAALGRAEGVADLIASLSVTDVKNLLRVIGRCNIGQRRTGAREKAVEELLHALLPWHYRDFAGSELANDDERPLDDYYAQVVPACSSEFVEQLLDAKDQSNPLYLQLPVARLIKTHGKLLRKRVVDVIFGNGDKERDLDVYLNAFLYCSPSLPSADPKISASMAFAMRALQLRLEDIDNDSRWPAAINEADIFFSLLYRSIKRKLPSKKIHGIFQLGLDLLEAKPRLKHTFLSKDIVSNLITRWKKDPTLYQDVLGLALRLELDGSQKTIGQSYLQSSRALTGKAELRWPLLRLYCLCIPKNGVDLDTQDDLKALAKQKWSVEVFERLENEQAVRLLKGLLAVNPEYNFLGNTTWESILSTSDITSHRNFNATLFLILLQRSSEETQRRAEAAVNDLRKKAATAKEQSDRAQFAKAAATYAIASGSLDIYGETILWQQRFIRDPLTSKAIFGSDAVTTTEGIDLLTGIPQPLPDGIKLDSVASSVGKANEILMTFHETMLIAKREPFFHQPDWAGVSSLLGSVIQKRITHAKDLQTRLQDSKPDFYSAIWSGTLAMLEKVNVEFLNQAHHPITSLLITLPPTVLATTTKSMLDTGNERRKKKDRQPGDDILETLSYVILLKLSKGDRPELAQQLVLRTILDRPDASSWHRQLLSVKFMKRLSAKDAHDMLLAFAKAIGEKLEEQSYVQVGATQLPSSAPPQSLVKVTTVKYLAQLLDNSEFLSADAAVEVLVELFKSGTHRDIRLATMDGLLSLLSNLCAASETAWKTNPLVEKIMAALENVISVVGSVNERRPPRAEDWNEARETGVLPDISDISAGLPPLLSAILTAADETYKYAGLRNLQAEFVARYLLPALELSQAEHRKWVAMFLAKHKAKLSQDDIPSTPISPEFWDILVGRYPEYIPRTVLEDFNEHVVMTLAPPLALKSFNQALKKDVDLRNTPEVQHWLSVFDRSINRYDSSGTHTLTSMIHKHRPSSSVSDGITFGNVLGMVMQHAALFLNQYEKYADFWNDFTVDLQRPAKAKFPLENAKSLLAMVSSWQESGRIVLEKVTALVVERRNGQVQKREQSFLPSATKLLLWLLPYPCLPEGPELDSQCQKFTRELDGLLAGFLKGEANVLRWPSIAKDSFTISRLLNSDEQRLCVAYHVGGLAKPQEAVDQASSALNLVRIELAMKLIGDGRAGLRQSGKGKVSEQKRSLAQRLRTRVEEWQRHPGEEIREKVADWRKESRDIWKTLTTED